MNTLFWIVTILFILSLLYIFIFTLEQFYLFLRAQNPDPHKEPANQESDLPYVCIQLPVCNEKYVVADLLKSVCNLAYPKNKLEIQILDDSTDETSEVIQNYIHLENSHGIEIHHLKRDNREGFKAGALKNGLQKSKADFIVIFDADFRPQPDFLLKTIPYFEDPKLGVIQTRWGHTNKNETLITKIQSVLIDNHFLIEQKGRFHGDMFLQFSGTGGVWRKTAIEDAGGWQSDTIIEDVDLSIRAQLREWKIVLLSDIVCPAQLPSDINSLKIQQFRWMQGGAEVSRKHLATLWKSTLSFRKKFHVTLHLTTGFIYFVVFMLSILTFPVAYSIQKLEIGMNIFIFILAGWAFSLSAIFLTNYKSGKNTSPLSKRDKVSLPMAIILVVSTVAISFHNSVALFKGTFGIKTPFKRTPKFNKESNKIDKQAYKVKVSLITYFEISLAIYFLITALIAWYTQNYIVSIVHVFFAFSYTAISLLSFGFELKFLNKLIR